MALVGLFYGSDTGNTENIAKMIQKKLVGITALPDAMRYKLLKHYARRQ